MTSHGPSRSPAAGPDGASRPAGQGAGGAGPACRFCGAPLGEPVVDLGTTPLANNLLEPHELSGPETHYPLGLWLCGGCSLAQLPAFASPEAIFGEYTYFSSFSESWLAHARAYVEMMIDRFSLDHATRVVEVASNDGYLLQYFLRRGLGVLGVEPAANVGEAARGCGVPTVTRFFGADTARDLLEERGPADVLVANNVMAHVPDLNDFVAGISILLADDGVATIEVQDLLRLVEATEFDTIYHEHFTYFSLPTIERVMEAHGLRVFDVEELPTHGGSLRSFVCRAGSRAHEDSPSLRRLRARAQESGLGDEGAFRAFARRVEAIRLDLLLFLLEARAEGRTVAGYGAPAKAVTLLGYCGVRRDLVPFTVDRNPRKQGRFLPGCRIPILELEEIARARPDHLLILPWNLREEIMAQMADLRGWGCTFVVPIPELRVYD